MSNIHKQSEELDFERGPIYEQSRYFSYSIVPAIHRTTFGVMLSLHAKLFTICLAVISKKTFF